MDDGWMERVEEDWVDKEMGGDWRDGGEMEG